MHWRLDVGFNEDSCSIRREHAGENLAAARHIALNLLTAEKSFTAGIKRKQKKANRSNAYLSLVLADQGSLLSHLELKARIGLASIKFIMSITNFSVLMSLYIKESPQYLEECLKSLYNQTVRASEIIIVYDGPVLPEHESVVEKWVKLLPIKVIKLAKNQGLGKALNLGLANCSYELVARMDTDDICENMRFENQLREFDLDASLTLCGSSIEEVEGSTLEFISNRTVPQSHEEILQALPSRNPFNHMTVMYKKSHVLDVGGYQPLHFMEDWYLWIRVLSAGYRSKNIPLNLVRARTGASMIYRRSGISYIESEYKMTLAKLFYDCCSIPFAFYIFFKRSLPRILPKTLLGKIYLISRKK